MKDETHRHSWLCKFWCFIGLHRWTHPGGRCDCCLERDTFFDRDGGYV